MIRNNCLNDVKVHDEIFILDIEANKYYGLNSTAAYVWDKLCVPITFDELCQSVYLKYAVDEHIAKEALSDLIGDMIKRTMIIEFVEV